MEIDGGHSTDAGRPETTTLPDLATIEDPEMEVDGCPSTTSVRNDATLRPFTTKDPAMDGEKGPSAIMSSLERNPPDSLGTPS